MTTASTNPSSAKSDSKFCVKHFSRDAYSMLVAWAGPVCLSIFLLLIRIVWGYAFFVAGKGKLADIQKPIAFFTNLHIPAPAANAWLVSIVECFGGLLLLFGLGSRAICIALVINMTVAYITADSEALHALFSGDADIVKFSAAAPFWFLVVSFTVLALGPGMFSIDALLKRFVFRRASATRPLGKLS